MPAGASVADVGCGDGQLTAALRARGHRVVAIEKSAGPAARAEARIGAVRIGDGLQPLVPGEVEVAAIAGMGGETIAGILDRAPAVVSSLRLLVLQPVQRERRLREWLAGRGFAVVDERPAMERGRRYTVLVVRPR